MPLPILVGIAAWQIAAVAITTAAAAYGAKKAIDTLWAEDDAKPIAKKKIAIVGGPAIGKSLLINFLKNGEYIVPNKPNLVAETAIPTYLMSQLGIDASGYLVSDVPGGGRHHWRSALEDADIVIYITKAKEILFGDEISETRIDVELKDISDYVKGNKKCFFGVFVSWCDCLDDYSETDAFYASIESKIKTDIIYKKIQTYFSCKNFLVSGSLLNKESTARLFSRLLRELKNA